jgi:hypothetical protein
MTNKELAETLRIAAESQENIALRMLLVTAADRIEGPCSTCEALARTVMMDKGGTA